jgi:hypothetical protein
MQHLDDSLKEVFATYQWVEVLPDDWFAAAIIGAMRTGVNDLIRGSTRDRRAERNMRNDTSGVLAEILVIRQVEKALPSQELSYQLLDLRKTTDMLDVQVAGSEAGLEAKSVLLLEEVRRHDFAINEIAANRSKRRRAMGYIGVLMAMGSRYALLSRVVPMDEVKSWPIKTYGEHKDPAHAMDLRDFAVKHAGLPEDKPLAIIEDFLERTLMVDPRAIEDVYMRAHTVMRVQLELQMKGHGTSVGPKLEELVRALRSQGEAAD